MPNDTATAVARGTGACTLCGKAPKARGKNSWCLACKAARQRATRPSYAAMSPADRERSRCRAYTNVLIKRGVLTRQPCESCGAARVQAHHADYSKPREVHWLCRGCHVAHHADERKAAAHE